VYEIKASSSSDSMFDILAPFENKVVAFLYNV